MIHNHKGFGFIEPAGFSWLTMMKWEAERNILIFIKNCELNSRFSTSSMAQHCVPWPRKFFFSVLSQMPRRKKKQLDLHSRHFWAPTKNVNSFLVDLVVAVFFKITGKFKKTVHVLTNRMLKNKTPRDFVISIPKPKNQTLFPQQGLASHRLIPLKTPTRLLKLKGTKIPKRVSFSQRQRAMKRKFKLYPWSSRSPLFGTCVAPRQANISGN